MIITTTIPSKQKLAEKYYVFYILVKTENQAIHDWEVWENIITTWI